MANNQNNTLDPTMNPASVYFLHPSDTTQKNVSEAFNGSSYGDWKRSVMIALAARNKLGFVNGSVQKSGQNSPNYKAQERVNNVVIGWLIRALDIKIGRCVMWFKTTEENWKHLEE